MKSNYKKLGEYIELEKNRNTNLQYGETDVRGVSNNKEIILTKANNKNRSFNNFFVVSPNEFIYNSRTSRMGDKVGLGYNDTNRTFITSFNNTVFRVKNEFLLPMYLYMWFKRPEFDRYARYHSWGSSTEIFSWDDMCNVELPVPSVEKQREIVRDYNTIVNRIRLNERLNQKLEETAQAIYQHWFMDFEFPMTPEYAESIGKPELEGQPYRSSGGEMVHNEELNREIPVGWEVLPLSGFFKSIHGGDWGKEKPEGNYQLLAGIIRGADIPNFANANFTTFPTRYLLPKNLTKKRIKPFDIIIEISGGSPIQSTGRTALVTNAHYENVQVPIVCSNFCRRLELKDTDFARLIFRMLSYLYSIDYMFSYENSTTGVKNFDINAFLSENYLATPPITVLKSFNRIMDTLSGCTVNFGKEKAKIIGNLETITSSLILR